MLKCAVLEKIRKIELEGLLAATNSTSSCLGSHGDVLLSVLSVTGK